MLEVENNSKKGQYDAQTEKKKETEEETTQNRQNGLIVIIEENIRESNSYPLMQGKRGKDKFHDHKNHQKDEWLLVKVVKKKWIIFQGFRLNISLLKNKRISADFWRKLRRSQ